MPETSIFSLQSDIILEKQQYVPVLSISQEPTGPLRKYCKLVHVRANSEFQQQQQQKNSTSSCKWLISKQLCRDNFCAPSNWNYSTDWMGPDEITDLFSYLVDHRYEIDHSMTKLITRNPELRSNASSGGGGGGKKLICFVRRSVDVNQCIWKKRRTKKIERKRK